MAAKESQKVKPEGYGTNQPNDSTNIVTQGKVPPLGPVGVVPDKSTPESTRGGKS